MTPSDAMRLLGFTAMPLSPVAVKVAFAKRVKEVHPDTRMHPTDRTPIFRLQEARDMLLRSIAALTRSCRLCGGSGRVALEKCGGCRGSGERRGLTR